MLSREDNELLTRVSGNAPMGVMIRQHGWIPAARSAHIAADGKPLRVRLFGADHVAFRATDGRVGFFDEACPHRGASLARHQDIDYDQAVHGSAAVDGSQDWRASL